MSIEAKQSFIRSSGKHIGNIVTANQLSEITSVLNLELANYEMEHVFPAELDSDTSDFLDAFLAAKELEGRSDSTLRLYGHVLSKFFDNIHVPIRSITVFHLRKFLQTEKDKGLSDRTLDNDRSILCSFFGWCHSEGLLPLNPATNLAPIKYAKVVRMPFTDVEIKKMMNACSSIRDQAIIMFFLATGCRVSEVINLNRSDIDFINKECIVFGKGAKERQVYLTEVALSYLEDYLSTRTDNYPALFASRSSERLTANGIRKMLSIVSDKSGVQNVHPHRFRRTLATNLIAHGMPVQEVAAILGHDKLDTTMEYVSLSKDLIRNNYRRYA